MNEPRIRTIEFAQHGATFFHPISVIILIGMSALVFSRRRSSATLAILIACAFIPMDQRLVVGGLDFSMLRLVSLLATVRVLLRGEYRGIASERIDRVFLLWVASASLFYLLRLGPSAIAYRLGVSFDQLTAFLLMRTLVRTPRDVRTLWKQLAWIVLVLAPFMLYEAISSQNPFDILRYGGSTEAAMRDGRVRAAGAFSHPILAGTFGSILTPVLYGLFKSSSQQKRLYGAAAVAATIVTFSSASSGPLIAWGFGALGWMLHPVRRHMPRILWSTLGMAVVIHFVRDAPVWHLIARLSTITGGTGYHRYRLIDAFVERFGEWALLGTSNTASWGWGLQDTTSQYIAEGVNGGLVTLILFVVLLRTSFVQLRRTRLRFERLLGQGSVGGLVAWGCSVSLAVHCVSFISVSYFGQMQVFFALFIATIPGLTRFQRSGLRTSAHHGSRKERSATRGSADLAPES